MCEWSTEVCLGWELERVKEGNREKGRKGGVCG